MRATLPLVIVILLGTACGDDTLERPPPPVVMVTQPPQPTDNPDRLYDDEGNLLESDDIVAGLRLPRGLEAAGEMERFHAYRTNVPIDKIHAYFGPRLMTGQVDRHGSGATFREAIPRSARGGVVKLDVSVVPMNRTATRIEIRELPPVPTKLPNEADVIRQWNEEQRRLD